MALLLWSNLAAAQIPGAESDWFNLSDQKMNDLSNEAVIHLSKGLGNVLISLAAGRSRNVVIDGNLAKAAIEELIAAANGFDAVRPYISLKSINPRTIRDKGHEADYGELLLVVGLDLAAGQALLPDELLH
jgi:hypothetical protein